MGIKSRKEGKGITTERREEKWKKKVKRRRIKRSRNSKRKWKRKKEGKWKVANDSDYFELIKSDWRGDRGRPPLNSVSYWPTAILLLPTPPPRHCCHLHHYTSPLCHYCFHFHRHCTRILPLPFLAPSTVTSLPPPSLYSHQQKRSRLTNQITRTFS